MIVVVPDTNVFVRETHLLNKKGGPELIRILNAINGKILMPEILYRECVDQSVTMAKEDRHKVEAALSAMETLLGMTFPNTFPDDIALKRIATDRLRSLEALTITDSLTPELHVAAGNRTIENKPPTTKTDHGYKDCLIWESVLRLQPGSKVRLISRDKAFYEGDSIIPFLRDEANAKDIEVVCYKEVEALVRDLIADDPDLSQVAQKAPSHIERTPTPIDYAAEAVLTPVKAEVISNDQQPPKTLEAIVNQLSAAQKRFGGLDLKVLGYISYLDAAPKSELFQALTGAGVEIEVAENIAERLKINGFIRDTGSHYLVTDHAIAEQVVPMVEAEIISLLDKTRERR